MSTSAKRRIQKAALADAETIIRSVSLSVPEAAAVRGTTEATIRYAITRGSLDSHRLLGTPCVRILKADITPKGDSK